jgi:hypothetical protein
VTVAPGEDDVRMRAGDHATRRWAVDLLAAEPRRAATRDATALLESEVIRAYDPAW